MIQANSQRPLTISCPAERSVKGYAQISCSTAHTVYHQSKQERLFLLVTDLACFATRPACLLAASRALVFSACGGSEDIPPRALPA